MEISTITKKLSTAELERNYVWHMTQVANFTIQENSDGIYSFWVWYCITEQTFSAGYWYEDHVTQKMYLLFNGYWDELDSPYIFKVEPSPAKIWEIAKATPRFSWMQVND